jgi:hypothetical protein
LPEHHWQTRAQIGCAALSSQHIPDALLMIRFILIVLCKRQTIYL